MSFFLLFRFDVALPYEFKELWSLGLLPSIHISYRIRAFLKYMALCLRNLWCRSQDLAMKETALITGNYWDLPCSNVLGVWVAIYLELWKEEPEIVIFLTFNLISFDGVTWHSGQLYSTLHYFIHNAVLLLAETPARIKCGLFIGGIGIYSI